MSWTCCKCNCEVEEVYDISITYESSELPQAEGLRCPTCGKEYLLSDYVTGELNSAEQMLEGK